MSDPSKSLGVGTHPNKIGVCSHCGKHVRYGKRYNHGCDYRGWTVRDKNGKIRR